MQDFINADIRCTTVSSLQGPPLQIAAKASSVSSVRILLELPGINPRPLAGQLTNIILEMPDLYDELPAILVTDSEKLDCLYWAVRPGGGDAMGVLLTHPMFADDSAFIRAVSNVLLNRAIVMEVLHEMPQLIGLEGTNVNYVINNTTFAPFPNFMRGLRHELFHDDGRSILFEAVMSASPKSLLKLLEHPSADLTVIDCHEQTALHAASLIAPDLALVSTGVYDTNDRTTLTALQKQYRGSAVKAAQALRILLKHLSRQPHPVIKQVMEQVDINGFTVLHAVCLLPGLLGHLPELIQPPFVDAIDVNASSKKYGSPLTIAFRYRRNPCFTPNNNYI